MEKVVRRAIFSGDKRIFGYLYFVGKSPFDFNGEKGTILSIMRELFNEDNIADEKKIFARMGTKDLKNNVYRVLSKDSTIMDISDVLEGEQYSCVVEDGYETMVYVESVEDVERYKFVTYMRCGINTENFEDIVDAIRKVNVKLIICGINDEVLYGKAEKFNPDCYEGIAVASQMAQTEMGDFFLESTIKKAIEILKRPTFDIDDLVYVIATDSKLTYVLLGLANTMGIATIDTTKSKGNKFFSLYDALLTIGQENLLHIAELTRQNTSKSKTFTDFIKMDMFRAEFCKLLNNSIYTGLFNKNEKLDERDAYMIGLLSRLDILSNKSMKEVLRNLNQSEEIVDALVYEEGIGGTLLKLMLAQDDGKTAKIEKYANQLGIKVNKIQDIYFEAMANTNRRWIEVHEAVS